MLRSKLLLVTRKDAPKEAIAESHKLLVRAGLFHASSASGLWEALPVGVRVLDKLQRIIREEMDAEGFQRVELPSLCSSGPWKKTGRFESAGREMFKFKDRHGQDVLLCPTHEESVAFLVQQVHGIVPLSSMPFGLYQIGRKFRDEVRPRAGLLRGREFLMKDLYTFHKSNECAKGTYEQVCNAYDRIFSKRLGKQVIKAQADSSSMGGQYSHEFHLESSAGEDQVLVCDRGSYAANVEAAFYSPRNTDEVAVEVISQGKHRVRVPSGRTAIPHLVLRHHPASGNSPDDEIIDAIKLNIVQAREGDECSCEHCSCQGRGRLVNKKCIEVGHAFFLSTFYSQALGVHYSNPDRGGLDLVQMACFGLGVTRIIAALVETGHDKHGIIWPKALAPFRVVIAPAPQASAAAVSEAFQALKQKLGSDLLLDDRSDTSFSVKMIDAKLIGASYICVVGSKKAPNGFELHTRGSDFIQTPSSLNELIQLVAV